MTEPTAPNPVTVMLTVARDYLLTHGWRPGAYRHETGEICMVEALTVAIRSCRASERDRIRYGSRAMALLEQAAGTRSVILWQDEPRRKWGEVRLAYDRAIRLSAGPRSHRRISAA